jgi:hypothetical protein
MIIDQRQVVDNFVDRAAPLPPIKLRRPIPDGLTLGANKYGTGIFATKRFSKGAVIYKGHYQVLEASEAIPGRQIILDTLTGVVCVQVRKKLRCQSFAAYLPCQRKA